MHAIVRRVQCRLKYAYGSVSMSAWRRKRGETMIRDRVQVRPVSVMCSKVRGRRARGIISLSQSLRVWVMSMTSKVRNDVKFLSSNIVARVYASPLFL